MGAARFCFLNSYSVIPDDEWLAKLALGAQPPVGLAGASGSWEAQPGTEASALWVPLLLPPWRQAPEPLPSMRLGARDRAWLAREWVRRQRQFPPFPSPHLRTKRNLSVRGSSTSRQSLGKAAHLRMITAKPEAKPGFS